MLSLFNLVASSLGGFGECLAASVAGLGPSPCASVWDTSQEWLISVNQSGKVVSVLNSSQCITAASDTEGADIFLGDCMVASSWMLQDSTMFLATDTTKCVGLPTGAAKLVLETCAGEQSPSQTDQKFEASSGPLPINAASTRSGISALRIQNIPCTASNQQCGGGAMTTDKDCCRSDWKCTDDDGQGGKYFKQCCLNGKCN